MLTYHQFEAQKFGWNLYQNITVLIHKNYLSKCRLKNSDLNVFKGTVVEWQVEQDQTEHRLEHSTINWMHVYLIDVHLLDQVQL